MCGSDPHTIVCETCVFCHEKWSTKLDHDTSDLLCQKSIGDAEETAVSVQMYKPATLLNAHFLPSYIHEQDTGLLAADREGKVNRLTEGVGTSSSQKPEGKKRYNFPV